LKPVIEQNDVLEWARTYDGPKFHALICDPPYHLVKCGRVLGASDLPCANCPRCGGELERQRKPSGGGFMGKTWDGGDIAFRSETWAALAEHLHPGAFGMAFASTRGWHRMAEWDAEGDYGE